jgi:hypothetical protein
MGIVDGGIPSVDGDLNHLRHHSIKNLRAGSTTFLTWKPLGKTGK